MSRYSTGKVSSLLKDGSWIKKADDEDEDVDRDPNFGKSILGQRSETIVGPDGEEVKTTTTTSRSTSVQSLSKKFSGSQDELRSGSTLPSSPTTSSYTKSTYSTLKSDYPSSTTTTSKTTVTEEPKKSTRTTSVSRDGTSETTITTSKSVSSTVIKSPTTTFTERVKSSSKGPLYSSYSPTRTTKETETSVSSSKNAENKLYDTLIPSAIKGDSSPTDSKTTVFETEKVMVKSSTDAEDNLFTSLIPSSGKEDYSSPDRNGTKTTTKTRTSSMAEDDLYGTLLPRSITSVSDRSPSISSSTTKREIITLESSRGVESSSLSSPSSTRTTSYSSYTDDLPSTRTSSYTISTTPSDDYSSDRKGYSYSRPDSSYDYSSITSPTSYTSKPYRSSSRSDDTDQIYSSSMKSVYAAPERAVLEKDLCTHCRKPFTGDAKMVLDDMKINCHASCFKCEVCNNRLSHMKAGDSIWIYKRMVHCENCFEVTRDKWCR
ncbi:sciellin isoform X2 [Anarrhichthys ocellatus]|uniref:sciellin isoform X2 n=1 Tax=Anarrhichthys ocellatus TaxID=433405 RepID=UPI0012EEC166|nr:sciellin isoform X2 [Anarrhichthys ocellatus]